ncbi:AMP-binding enzyme [Cupriavidus basilensis]
MAECGVIGEPDEERGQIVKAFVALHPGHAAGPGDGQDAAGLREARPWPRTSIRARSNFARACRAVKSASCCAIACANTTNHE